MTLRLVQIQRADRRRVAVVEEPRLHLLGNCDSVYSLAQEAISAGRKLTDLVKKQLTDEFVDYDSVYNAKSEWRLLPPVDCPAEPARCLITGTGLTHLGSATEQTRRRMAEMSIENLLAGLAGKPPPWRVG